MAVTLEARKLGYGYPGRPVGRDLELALGAGEVLCVLGPNGGGKTTLFRTLLGLLAAQAGEVRLEGQPLEALARSEVARRVGREHMGADARLPRHLEQRLVGAGELVGDRGPAEGLGTGMELGRDPGTEECAPREAAVVQRIARLPDIRAMRKA